MLIAELVYPSHTSVINGLFNESWYAGAIIAAGVTLGTFARKDNWAWRIPSIVQAVPSILQLTCIWFIPEVCTSCKCPIALHHPDKDL
jgi:MFS family permease